MHLPRLFRRAIACNRAITALLRRGLRWHVRVWRTGSDQWILFYALLELRHNLDGRPRVPRIPDCSRRILLLRIGDEVEGLGRAKFERRRPPVPLLVVKDDLPVSPLDRFQPIRHE